ncbi:MAG: sugar transferase, partial [bacterium]
MIRERELFLIRLMKIIDSVVIFASFCLSYYLTTVIRKYLGLVYWINFAYYIQSFFLLGLVAVPIWISTMSYYGVYKDFRTKPLSNTLWNLILSGGLTVIFLGSVTFIVKMQFASRSYVAVFIMTAILLLGIGKAIFSKILQVMHRSGYNLINLLIVGTGKRAQEFIEVVKAHADWGLKIVGLVDDDPKLLGKRVMDYEVIGRIRDIPRILRESVVDRVIFVIPRMWLNRIEEAIFHCEREGISTAISVDLYKPKLAQLSQSDFAGIPLLLFQTSIAKEWQLFIKRSFDIVFSTFCIVLLSPVFLLSMIGVVVSSRGPIFFRQVRCGMNGRKFIFYKFRSMYVGSEMRKRELERQNVMNGPVFKMRRDPRVTKFGRFMRKLSIDELPQ